MAASGFEVLSTIRYDPNLTGSSCILEGRESLRFGIADREELFCRHFERLWASGVPQDNRGFLFLQDHVDRINASFLEFGWDMEISAAQLLVELQAALPTSSDRSPGQCYKMRVLYAQNGHCHVEAIEIGSTLHPSFLQTLPQASYFVSQLLQGFISVEPPIWKVFINTEPIMQSSFTRFKTTNRQPYNIARDRMNSFVPQTTNCPHNRYEILLFNKKNELMEGSITNVAVPVKCSDSDNTYRYLTPSLKSGCLGGIMRNFLIKTKLVEPGRIDIRSLQNGDTILLFNSVMGCVKGTVVKEC